MPRFPTKAPAADLRPVDVAHPQVVHTHSWSDDISLDGKRVVLVGSGATAVPWHRGLKYALKIQDQLFLPFYQQDNLFWLVPTTQRPLRITPQKCCSIVDDVNLLGPIWGATDLDSAG